MDPYTPTGDDDPLAGTAIARLAITAGCDGKTLASTQAIYSTGKPVTVAYIKADGTPGEASAIALDGTETTLAAGWYFVGQPTVAFDRTLNLDGDVNLILVDGNTMKVRTTKTRDGISAEGHSLHIYGQTEGTGALNAQTNGKAVVISITNGTLGIHGGNVKANEESTVNTESAIRVVRATAGDALVIDRGTLTANSNSNSSCGIYIEGGDVRINGGQVTATGPSLGIDISDYEDGESLSIPGTLTLSGGTLTASSFYTWSGESCAGTLAIAPGLTYTDGTSLYDSTTETATLAALGGKTLQPCLTARQAPDGNYWTTYYNGATGFTIDNDENACAYTATYGGSQLTLHKLGKEIPKNTAVIIVADNSVVSMATTTLPAYSGDDNDLHGVDVDTDVDDLGTGTFYVLGMTTVDNEQHFGFHRYTGSTMAAHKAFVLVGSQARSLTMVFDEATGIVSAEANSSLFTLHSSLSTWFTLDGRRLQGKPTAPGIYVNNGRKVVIK